MTAAENIGIAARAGKRFKFTRSRANVADEEFFPGAGSTLHFANRDTDTFTARNIPAGLLQAGDTVKVQHKPFDNVYTWSTVFVGEVDHIVDRHGRGDDRVQDVTVVGPWSKLSRIVFRQTWGSGNVAFSSSRVILGQKADGTAQHMKAQLAEIVNYAAANGCDIEPNSSSNNAPELYLPLDEARDITCADAIRRVLRFFPNLCVVFAYGGSRPGILIGSTLGGQRLNQFLDMLKLAREYVYNAHPVKYVDVTVDAVEVAVNGDDVSYHQIYPTPPSGTTPSPLDVLHVTIPLAKGGGSTTSESFKIETENVPSSLNDKDWWCGKHPRLSGIAKSSITITDGARDDSGESTVYPRILKNAKEEVEAAGKHCRVTRFTCKCKISTTDDEEEEILLSMDFLTTDAETRTYTVQTGSTATAGETLPAGLAQALYEQRSQSLLSETMTVRVDGYLPAVGNRISEQVGDHDEYLYLQTMDVDVIDMTARLTFGQPEHLSPEDMKSLLNGFRQRGSASTAVLREQKGAEEGEEQDAPGGIPPIASSEWKPGTKVKTALKKTNGGTIKINATSAGTIDMRTSHVGSGKTAQFRDFKYTDSNGTEQTIKVLSTAAATIPPGGIVGTKTEDVITDISFAFDSSSHQLTATLTKKRLTVINKADISGAAPTALLPLYENDVVVGSEYDTSSHQFTNSIRPGVVTDTSSQPTTDTVFTSTAHSAE